MNTVTTTPALCTSTSTKCFYSSQNLSFVIHIHSFFVLIWLSKKDYFERLNNTIINLKNAVVRMKINLQGTFLRSRPQARRRVVPSPCQNLRTPSKRRSKSRNRFWPVSGEMASINSSSKSMSVLSYAWNGPKLTNKIHTKQNAIIKTNFIFTQEVILKR